MLCGLLLLTLAVQAPVERQVQVLVAYHSDSGHTEKMARAAAAGAAAAGSRALVKRVAEVTREDLLQADAILLGSPVHMGDVAVEVRRALVDWSLKYGFWESRQLQDKVAAVFATGGSPSSGKEFTMLSMAQSLLQLGMVLVAPYGSLGASATTAVPESDKGVDDRELEEARRLGERAARVARRMLPTASVK